MQLSIETVKLQIVGDDNAINTQYNKPIFIRMDNTVLTVISREANMSSF